MLSDFLQLTVGRNLNVREFITITEGVILNSGDSGRDVHFRQIGANPEAFLCNLCDSSARGEGEGFKAGTPLEGIALKFDDGARHMKCRQVFAAPECPSQY